MNWTPEIDPTTIPDSVLHSEIGRRRSLKRKVHAAGPGRPPIFRICPKCLSTMTATQMRNHSCGEPETT